MAFSINFLILFGVAMLCSAIGFYKYVYFISIGYGAAIAGQWIVAILGLIGIIFVMFSDARRLEIRQNKNYGSDPEYQEYVKKVPILIPFVPLYSVEKYKFLVL